MDTKEGRQGERGERTAQGAAQNSAPKNHLTSAETGPKTSRDFFRDLETSASLKPDTAETSKNSTAKTTNLLEKQSFYRPKSPKNSKNQNPQNLNPEDLQNRLKNPRNWNFKKATPLAVIIGGLAACLFVIFGSTSLLGAHLEALYTEATDTQYTSTTLRGTRLMSYMLTGGNQLDTTWTGGRKYKTFSPWLKSRLQTNGIDVVSDGGATVLKFNGETISADNFVTTYRDNVAFREAYTSSKRGRAAGFFDDAADKIYQKLGLSRDVMQNFRQTGNGDADEAAYRETLSKEFAGESAASIKTAEDQPVRDENGEIVYDDDGNPVMERVEASNSGTPAEAEGDSPTSKATNYLAKATAVASTACGALRIGSMIATTISAVETYQTIHYFMNLTENYSKYKYGDGDASAVNQVNNFFTREVTAEYPNAQTGEIEEVTGSPLNAESARVILGQVAPDLKTAEKYSVSRLSKFVKGTMATYGATAVACNVTNALNAAVSLALLAIPGGGLVKLASSLLVDFAFKLGAEIAVTAVLSFVVPTIARVLFENAFDALTGVPAGEAYGKGAAAANTQVAARGSGQTGASADKLSTYQRETREILALDAELDRYTHSPFDASNKNTFLGSIVNSALSFATTTSAIGPLTTLSNLTKNGLASLTGSVSAAAGTDYFDYYGDCPELEEIGVKGDMYCNRITMSDPSTLDLAPDDEDYIAVIEPNLEEDEEGNEAIQDGSRLAFYIIFCTERDSPWGVYDASIASAFETHLGVFDNLPYIEDAVTLANALEDLEAEPWATGLICNDTDKNPWWDSEIKYYQRYVEDNRILGQLGAYNNTGLSDPVLAYKDYYYAENPLDNSIEGYLARITGYSKDDIATMLDVVEYYTTLADYEPENTYAFDDHSEAARLFTSRGLSEPDLKKIFTDRALEPFEGGPTENLMKIWRERKARLVNNLAASQRTVHCQARRETYETSA